MISLSIMGDIPVGRLLSENFPGFKQPVLINVHSIVYYRFPADKKKKKKMNSNDVLRSLKTWTGRFHPDVKWEGELQVADVGQQGQHFTHKDHRRAAGWKLRISRSLL